MDWTIVASIASAIGVIVAAFATLQSLKIHREQQALSKAIHIQQQQTTQSIHDQQILLAQRQLLLPLYNHLYEYNFSAVDPSNPNYEALRRAANTLELVAICWEGGLIDQDVLRRMFEQTFIETYESINQCIKLPPNFPMDGPAMLRASPATRKLYQLLTKETAERGSILG